MSENNRVPDDVRRCFEFMCSTAELAANAAAAMQALGVGLAGLPGTELNRRIKEQRREYRRFPRHVRLAALALFQQEAAARAEDVKVLTTQDVK